MTLKDFRTNGSIVTNEDDKWTYKKLKDNYHNEVVEEKNTPTVVNESIDKKEVLDFNSLQNVTLITDGVCGKKLPCVSAITHDDDNNNDIILKAVNKACNFGKDYAYVDEQKDMFKLNRVYAKPIVLNRKLTRMLTDIYVWKFENAPYLMMRRVKNCTDLGKRKELLDDEIVFNEMLKIRLFNGIFLTSDNIVRNILVDENCNLFAIDENDMMGKRKTIFNAKESVKLHTLFTKERILFVIKEMDLPSKKVHMLENLKKYDLYHLSDKIADRIDRFESIVLSELNM